MNLAITASAPMLASVRVRRRGMVVSMRSTSRTAEVDRLLEQIARGDQEAFAAFYDLTAPAVFGIVLRVLRDRAQAEEVTQEVYVDAWRNATRFDSAFGAAAGWLNTIAHRKAVDRVRSVERSTARDQRHHELEPQRSDDEVSELVVARDESRRVHDALEQLPENQRTVVRLAYFEGRSQREVAEHLQIPLGTAKTRIRDALKRLRTHLGEAQT